MRYIPFLLAWLLNACTTTDSQGQFGGQPLTVASLDLFSQIDPPKGGKNWSGDWQLRRDRLDLVDETLRDSRPDIVAFQNVMKRAGSVSESDELILKSGALNQYSWSDALVQHFAESGEEQFLSVAVAKPLQFPLQSKDAPSLLTKFGNGGNFTLFPVQSEDGLILVFNVQLPLRVDRSGTLYSLLQQKILDLVASYNSCLERVIIAGHIPVEQDSRRFREFQFNLKLKDTAVGFCQNAEDCFTASSQNGIFAAVRGDETSAQVDRILVNKNAKVLAAGISFTRTMDTSEYKQIYGLTKVWASERYGWSTRVRLPVCASPLIDH